MLVKPETRKNNISIVFIFMILFSIGILFAVNRDIFHYEYLYSKPIVFTPDQYTKNTYFLTDSLLLKPGDYLMTFSGEMKGKKSSVFLENVEGIELISMEFVDGEKEYSEVFSITGNENVRLGVRYDPEKSTLQVNRIKIESDNVLYRDTIIRHIVVSGFILVVVALLFFLYYKKIFYRSVFIVILLTSIICLPYFNSGYFLGDDLFFHLNRIEGIAQTLKAGYFPARNQLYWLQNYGYGVGYFYPDLFLYFPALLRILGFSMLASYKIFMTVVTLCSLLSFYYTAKIISRNETCGIFSALIAAFSVFRLVDMYNRAAIGEVQSLIFGPFIILGLYCIYNEHPEKWHFFAFGFWGIANSHLISLGMSFVLVGIYILFRLKKSFQHKEIFRALVKSVLVVAALEVAFILPMIEQLSVGNLVINILTSISSTDFPEKIMVPPAHLFYFFHTWRDGTFHTNHAYPGLFFLIIPLLRLLHFNKKSRLLKCADVLTIFGVFLLFASTSLFPWHLFAWFLNRIQYAWRLFTPASVVFPISGAIYITFLTEHNKYKKQLYSVFIFIIAACGFPLIIETLHNRIVSKDLFWMQNNRVSGAEYKPFTLDLEFVDKNKDTVIPSDPDVRISNHNRERLTFKFSWDNADSAEVLFEVPLIDYIGYHAELITSDNNSISIPVLRSERGLVLVKSDGYREGTIRVYFEKTVLETVSEIFTVSVLLFLLVIMIRRIYKKKKLEIRNDKCIIYK